MPEHPDTLIWVAGAKPALGRLFGGNKRNKQIASWAKTVQISESQRTAMEELWYTGKENCPPSVDPLKKPSENDAQYIFKMCDADFRPKEFGSKLGRLF